MDCEKKGGRKVFITTIYAAFQTVFDQSNPIKIGFGSSGEEADGHGHSVSDWMCSPAGARKE